MKGEGIRDSTRNRLAAQEAASFIARPSGGSGGAHSPPPVRGESDVYDFRMVRKNGKMELDRPFSQKDQIMPTIPAFAARVAALPDPTKPLWDGPCATGPSGGITQSMLQRFLSCRERFRLRYIEGLAPTEAWRSTFGYGNMWHVCEEALALANDTHESPGAAAERWTARLTVHTRDQMHKHPLQREEIDKWYKVCCVQFPEYVKYWAAHPDVTERTPLMQEQVFDVPYRLPSGRTVRIRGKFDSVDLIDGGIWLQENKTKSNIDPIKLERQLKFDLQTMTYLVALEHVAQVSDEQADGWAWTKPLKGVRYNVIRRDLPIRKHKEKCTKPRYGTGRNAGKLLDPGKITPAETDEHFYDRYLNDYIRAEPHEWFFRLRSEVSARDIETFKRQFLTPILEQLCDWYECVTRCSIGESSAGVPFDIWGACKIHGSTHWRHPFGGYNAVDEQGSTEYDAMLDTNSQIGLHRTAKLFPELEEAAP